MQGNSPDLEVLLEALPPHIHAGVDMLENRYDLLEIVMDLGRFPEGRFPAEEVLLGDTPVSREDIAYVTRHIGIFGDDNRAGIERTLHRISAMRNRKGKIIGLTCRIGRAMQGSIALLQDILQENKSLLILGRPGVGKTTLLREMARVMADAQRKRVVIVDTSNEIAGDGDIPHPGIGRARRMQVAQTDMQHAVMIEAVENHMPQVIVIDEIGTELEAMAARTIAERGVQLIATAHGNSLENLISNPSLADLIGGIQTVTLGDEEARRRGTQKSILERKAPPTFDMVIEQQNWQEVILYQELTTIVDNLLRGMPVMTEKRTLDPETGVIQRTMTLVGNADITPWRMREEKNHTPPSHMLQPLSLQPDTRNGQKRIKGNGHVSLAQHGQEGMVSLLETRENTIDTYEKQKTIPSVPDDSARAQVSSARIQKKVTRVYSYGVNRDHIMHAGKVLHVPLLLTQKQKEADIVVALKNQYRLHPDHVKEAEQSQKLLVIVRNNSREQMLEALARVFHVEREEPQSADTENKDVTLDAIRSTEEQIRPLLDNQTGHIDLPPSNAYIRRVQHEVASRYNLLSKSIGKEPTRYVRIVAV